MITLMMTLAFSAMIGCSPPDPDRGSAGDSSTPDTGDSGMATGDAWCPDDMILFPAGTYYVGEWDADLVAQYHLTVIRWTEYVIEKPWCVAKFPFPGVMGLPYPRDGLYVEQLPALESRLAEYGRRLCTVPELLIAAAGTTEPGTTNWRYPFHPEEFSEEPCDITDGSEPAGSHPGCVSPAGAWDFNVRSAWGVMDATTTDLLAPAYGGYLPYLQYYEKDGKVYMVFGGVGRRDTFYAPNNFGIHFHPPDPEANYIDDSTRACADAVEGGTVSEDVWRDDVAMPFTQKFGSRYENFLGVGHD